MTAIVRLWNAPDPRGGGREGGREGEMEGGGGRGWRLMFCYVFGFYSTGAERFCLFLFVTHFPLEGFDEVILLVPLNAFGGR